MTPSTENEGVITADGTDFHGLADGNVKAGSTWSSVTTSGKNTTVTYTNTLGQAYLVQKTQPGSAGHPVQLMTDAITSFDGAGRVIKYVDFDGTTTYSSYDPATGQLASQFVDMNGNHVDDAGIDRKSKQKPTSTSLPAAGAVVSNKSDDYANTGIDEEIDSEQLTDSGTNAGSDSKQTVNGATTETQTPPASGGGWTRARRPIPMERRLSMRTPMDCWPVKRRWAPAGPR